VHVAFEEGTQAQWLHDLLLPHVTRVVVCNVRGPSETSNKSDRIDADWLSEQLRLGALKSVYHGTPGVATLKELVRCYSNLVDDSTRVMQRVKAMYRGRAIEAKGEAVYRPSQRKIWLAKLDGPAPDHERRRWWRNSTCRSSCAGRQEVAGGATRRAARAAQEGKSGNDRRGPPSSGWKVLLSVPFLGPIRVAFLLAIMATPFRFRGKRQLWPYAGLAMVTRTSSENEIVNGRPRRKKRAPLTRGLNRNHNRVLKNVFKGAANAAAAKGGATEGSL